MAETLRHALEGNKSETIWIMEGSTNLNVLAEYLRSAKPRLICRADINGADVKITPFISQADDGWDELLAEGYDSKDSPLGCPVYWRIVKRGDEQFYCSTFQVSPHQIVKAWGENGLAYCDPSREWLLRELKVMVPFQQTSRLTTLKLRPGEERHRAEDHELTALGMAEHEPHIGLAMSTLGEDE